MKVIIRSIALVIGGIVTVFFFLLFIHEIFVPKNFSSSLINIKFYRGEYLFDKYGIYIDFNLKDVEMIPKSFFLPEDELNLSNKALKKITRNGEASDLKTLVSDFVDINSAEVKYTVFQNRIKEFKYQIDEQELEDIRISRKEVIKDNSLEMELIQKDKVEDKYIYSYSYRTPMKNYMDELYGVYIDTEGVKIDNFSIINNEIYTYMNNENKEKVESKYLERYLFILDFSKKNEGILNVTFSSVDTADKYGRIIIDKLKDAVIRRKADRYKEYMEAYNKERVSSSIKNEYELFIKKE